MVIILDWKKKSSCSNVPFHLSSLFLSSPVWCIFATILKTRSHFSLSVAASFAISVWKVRLEKHIQFWLTSNILFGRDAACFMDPTELQPPGSCVRPSLLIFGNIDNVFKWGYPCHRAKARSRVADMKPRLLLKYLPLNSGYSQYFAQLAMLKWTIVKTCCRISTFIQWHNLLHKAQATFNLETVLLYLEF